MQGTGQSKVSDMYLSLSPVLRSFYVVLAERLDRLRSRWRAFLYGELHPSVEALRAHATAPRPSAVEASLHKARGASATEGGC